MRLLIYWYFSDCNYWTAAVAKYISGEIWQYEMCMSLVYTRSHSSQCYMWLLTHTSPTSHFDSIFLQVSWD
jgi:hypothetical protein